MNLKTFSLSGDGAAAAFESPLAAAGSGGRVVSSFTRVSRALVRSRNGGTDMSWAPRQISAHELMKCHVAVPLSTA